MGLSFPEWPVISAGLEFATDGKQETVHVHVFPFQTQDHRLNAVLQIHVFFLPQTTKSKEPDILGKPE